MPKLIEMRTVLASFSGTAQHYSYFIPEGDNPQPGDYLVTSCTWNGNFDDNSEPSPSNALSSARIARVQQVEVEVNPKATRFYVALLSLDHLRDVSMRNKEVAAKAQERRKIITRLDRLVQDQCKLEVYRRLAETNPEARALLDQLD